MKKVKHKDKLKEYKKSTTTNVLAIAGIYALDFLVTMINVNLAYSANRATDLTSLILNWALATYLLIFVLLILVFLGVKNSRFKRVRFMMLVLIAITVLNLATFVYAAFSHSLMLVVPILMLLYMQEKTRSFIH